MKETITENGMKSRVAEMGVDELRATLEAVVGIVFPDGLNTELNHEVAWDVANVLITYEAVLPRSG